MMGKTFTNVYFVLYIYIYIYITSFFFLSKINKKRTYSIIFVRLLLILMIFANNSIKICRKLNLDYRYSSFVAASRVSLAYLENARVRHLRVDSTKFRLLTDVDDDDDEFSKRKTKTRRHRPSVDSIQTR